MPFRTMWYQFGPYEAYYHVGRYDDVVELANNTASTTLYVEEINYWRGMAYAALGRTEDAIFQFDETLRFNRNFVEAQTAKTLLETNAYAPPAPRSIHSGGGYPERWAVFSPATGLYAFLPLIPVSHIASSV
jgi:tetratricopeptide (TPR) repeat protein